MCSSDLTYYNDGDWVESCTALVEDADGAMRLIDWAEEHRLAAARTAKDEPQPTPAEREYA